MNWRTARGRLDCKTVSSRPSAWPKIQTDGISRAIGSGIRWFALGVACCVLPFFEGPLFAQKPNAPEAAPAPKLERIPGLGIPRGIVVRSTENVTKGGWVWILNQCESLGIQRIDLLVKQDEDNFQSARTGETLQSGELLAPLPGEKSAKGWENGDWLREMLAKAKEKKIEVWAWWPCFHDSQAAALYPPAAYSSKRGEKFVDPAFPEVRERQAALIAKLLDAYPFDGVSLDWVRYDGWSAGSQGPLGQEFARQYHFEWTPDALDNGYSKARWYEARARLLSGWVGKLVSEMRTVHPGVRWGAFLLPWQFSEDSQSYAMLGASGLDFLQPMGYWQDWKLPPEWVSERLLTQHRDLANGAAQWLTIGADAPIDETKRALDGIPFGLLGGMSWFTYGSWEQKTFDRMRQVLEQSAPARQLFGYDAPANPDLQTSLEIPAAPSLHTSAGKPPKAKEFPEDSSVWSVVCLAELYKRQALKPQGDDPSIPVLAMHTFAEGKAGSQSYLYKCTTDYLDSLLQFVTDQGFTVCPLSRLQNYLITRDPSCLPPKPLVLTIDDGSQSAHRLFFPRAVKRKLPFTLALITSWLSETDQSDHESDERGKQDASMTWGEAKEMYRSGLVEVVSHSDGMHYQTAESPAAQEDLPAEVTRQFLREYQRPETNEEYARRIRLDMITSRNKLVEHGFRPTTVFCWPYGEWNHTAKAIGERAGFTHFLLFDTPPVMATVESSREGVPRIPVLRPDELVPLQFPSDPREAQSWWLAFLKVGRDSCNTPLISATLAQLTRENQRRPEAGISRAVLDYLRGNTASGSTRLLLLRQAYPFDPIVTEAIDKTLKVFNPRPL